MDFDINKLFLTDSLYSSYNIYDLTFDGILKILFYNENTVFTDNLKTLDTYCKVCGKDTTFISKETDGSRLNNLLFGNGYNSPVGFDFPKFVKALEQEGTFKREFQCPRPGSDSTHDLVFIFKVIDAKLIKIGQNPSVADLTKKDIEKYRKFNSDIYQELNRAIGLASHGVGIGSFVYLRRIIEKHIVAPQIGKLIDEGIIKTELLNGTDFKSKIDLAKDRLPNFLIDNKKIYSILSKGIHELEEKECNEYFTVLRTAIEIILDEEIDRIEKSKKTKLISEQLSRIK